MRKKLKQPSFAAWGVDRDEVYAGAELLGLELDEHIANVVEALQPIAPGSGCARPRTRSGRRVRRPRAADGRDRGDDDMAGVPGALGRLLEEVWQAVRGDETIQPGNVTLAVYYLVA